MRVKGRYRNQKVELDQPLELAEGIEVEVEIIPTETAFAEAWRELGMKRLEEEWDNPRDAIYDDWRNLYGV
ncbi:MAG TPA: hypothetical protein VGG61_09425 [Gemmataceae bacterium]